MRKYKFLRYWHNKRRIWSKNFKYVAIQNIFLHFFFPFLMCISWQIILFRSNDFERPYPLFCQLFRLFLKVKKILFFSFGHCLYKNAFTDRKGIWSKNVYSLFLKNILSLRVVVFSQRSMKIGVFFRGKQNNHVYSTQHHKTQKKPAAADNFWR